MGDNHSASSFMMLTEHLYGVFVEYILSGRTRAPPENELVEMIPTFQFGAKTNRRALQSKFKSWAKRMNYENGYLTLMNSGKLIVSREKCDALVMFLHSEEHNDIEDVILQIRMHYTWTRKNFGMDRDFVVEIIMRNCKMEDCLRKMRMDVARFSNSFCSTVSGSLQPPVLTPDFTVNTPSPIPHFPPYSCQWTLPFPLSSMLAPNGNPYRIPILNDLTNLDKRVPKCESTVDISIKSSSNALSDNDEKMPNAEPPSNDDPLLSYLKAKDLGGVKFRKPKTVHQYKRLIEAAKHKPRNFPEILGNEKIKFLSTLGLVPKSMCCSETLKMFRKELLVKKALNRECMIYRERKTLRDRNKLKRCSDQRKRAYLEIEAFKNNCSPHKNKSVNGSWNVLRHPKRSSSNEKNVGDRNKKRMKLDGIREKESVEVIDIVSSDDETQQENISPGSAVEKEMKSMQGNKNLPSYKMNRGSKNHPSIKVIFQKTGQNLEKQKQQEAPMIHPIHQTFSPVNVYPLKELQANVSNVTQFVVPDAMKQGLIVKSRNSPKVSQQMQHFQIPKLSTGYGVPFNYVFPQIAIGQTQIEQPSTSFAVSNQNVIPQMLHTIPTNVTFQPVSNPKLVYVDRGQKGPFYILPQFIRPAFQQQFRTEKSVTEALKDPNTVLKSATSVSTQRYKGQAETVATGSQIENQSISGRIKKPVKRPSFMKRLVLKPRNLPEVQQIFRRRDSAAANVSIPATSGSTQQSQETAVTGTGAQVNKRKCAKRVENKERKTKQNINEEMIRISKWIYSLKSALDPNMFQQGLEKSVQRLISRLNVGIYLVRDAKKSLAEIEKTPGFRKFVEETD